VIKIRDVKLP